MDDFVEYVIGLHLRINEILFRRRSKSKRIILKCFRGGKNERKKSKITTRKQRKSSTRYISYNEDYVNARILLLASRTMGNLNDGAMMLLTTIIQLSISADTRQQGVYPTSKNQKLKSVFLQMFDHYDSRCVPNAAS